MSDVQQAHHPLGDLARETKRSFTKEEVRTILLDALRPLAAHLQVFGQSLDADGALLKGEEVVRALDDIRAVAERAALVAHELHRWYGYDSMLNSRIDEIWLCDWLALIPATIDGLKASEDPEHCGERLAYIVEGAYRFLTAPPAA